MKLYKMISEGKELITNDIKESRNYKSISRPDFYEIMKWFWEMKLFYWYYKLKYGKDEKGESK